MKRPAEVTEFLRCGGPNCNEACSSQFDKLGVEDCQTWRVHGYVQQLEKRAVHLEALNQQNLSVITMQERTRARLEEQISQLEAQNAALSENIMWMEAERDDLKRTIRQLQAEREMIRQAFCNYVPSVYRCDCCKHSYLNNPGTDCCPYYVAGQCDGNSKWEYYRIRKE